MKKGIITKLIGGLYTIKDNETQEKVTIRPRGNLRYKNQKPKVGDIVFYNEVIDSITERKNDLIRPAISNIDQAILIFSCIEPSISYSLLDRFLSLIESNYVRPVIIITKIDLCDNLDEVKQILSYYEKYYDIYYVSSIEEQGLEEVVKIFENKISVFTGQTGVGKSSLLNALGKFDLRTAEISKVLGRGKHTTRHVELFDLYGGLVADTPGFSGLEFIDMTVEDLRDSFKDFEQLSNECKYRGCFHEKEPLKDCKVKQEVENKNIIESRYKSYLAFLDEIKNMKVKY